MENKLDVCAIIETKVCESKLKGVCDEIFGNWGWITNISACEGRARIIVGWNLATVKMEFSAFFGQVVHGSILHFDSMKKLHCSFVYAANDVSNRLILWDQLLLHKNFVKSEPWCVLGDFNVALNPCDSSSGSSMVTKAMNDFRDCVNSAELEDINQMGLWYTWIQKPLSDGTLKGLLKKIDRVMGNLAFLDSFPNALVSFLPYGLSDHSPAVLSVNQVCSSKLKPKPFKFNNYLCGNPDFLPLVANAWKSYVRGCWMFSVVTKLKAIKKDLRVLKLKHGNVFDKVKKFRVEVDRVQSNIDLDPDNGEIRMEGAVYLKALKDALVDEESFLRQRAKIQWLKEGDANTTYFHSVVKSKCNKGRIDEIEDLEGNRVVGAAVADLFVEHFKKILGSSEVVDGISDPFSFFVKKLSLQQAEFMIRPFSDDEIKAAIFDTDDIKSPGPDGFSSKFYKKSWPIIGFEICLAVKEFFENGKLLGEVNATVIALVPKSQSPKNVAEFRPIACCNVLYKCISKLLVGRIKEFLGVLVDPNQSAFIPNRQISDNVLLAQELMRGYHRQRGTRRCAFKVDIQKAYDTVNWNFLEEILKRFGFHPCMICWIMKCVRSASFTIRVNGDHHGFFQGMRGIRQGDPLSPYLFTLVMEVLTLLVRRKVMESDQFRYHPKCEKIGLTHLCFADDLLMFCYGDLNSVTVLKNALLEFSRVSGLKPSLEKSTSFLGNVVGRNREEILNILPFKLGSLPVRYLGVPLLSNKLFHKDCLALIDKVKRRILDWKNKWLSFAGRLQLINSVLSSISVYWASMFLLPISVVNEIRKLLRTFLWSSGEDIRGKAKVSWSCVCLPREKRWIHEYRLKGRSFWDVGVGFDSSWFWRKAIRIRCLFRNQIVHVIGDGKDTSLWFDSWHPVGPLSQFISKREIYMARMDLDLKVCDVVSDGSWLWPVEVWYKHGNILQQFMPSLNSNVKDKIQWKGRDGSFSDFRVAAVWKDRFMDLVNVDWHKLVWYSQGIPRHAFVLWLAIKEKLRTLDRLVAWKVRDDNICVLCHDGAESHSHLFVDCPYSKEVWIHLEGFYGVYTLIQRMEGRVNGWSDLIRELSNVKAGNSIWSVIHRLIFAAVVYFIWQERNVRMHGGNDRSVVCLAKQIIDLVKMKLLGLRVKNNSQCKRAAIIWDLEIKDGGFIPKFQS
ncbi:hypothetical protein OSB04_006318 [Centaurea solstitialis]|uniref:Reverse transcriptase domain-containing protein n=1 Tax=Centaurea solstitialis TaxID=347529 RepID=A0AA38U2A7_9ASTR|nr:hypothetical protein OSB04_006318 [Centaurea solstitialis]